jgi:triphosphoribosyl-dephospho-CoA synthase
MKASNLELTISTDPTCHEEIIRRSLLSGMLLEASCHPSPGLVSPFSMGSHSDMNYFSFILSSVAVAPLLDACIEKGRRWNGRDDLLTALRPAGLSAEKAMLEATGGVNTQKGIIFLAGITAAAAAWTVGRQGQLTAVKVTDGVAAICKDLIRRELESRPMAVDRPMTQGEYWYNEAGITGIRGEVESGLPSIVNVSLPVFGEMIRKQSLNTAMVQTLLHLMTVVQDTTVLARAGIEGYHFVMESARKVISLGGYLTDDGRRALAEMDKDFIRRNISPGGSADLLAITIALFLMENGPLPQTTIID